MTRPYYADAPLSSPFSMMRRFMDDMDRLFGNFGAGTGSLGASPFESGTLSAWGGQLWTPSVEVFERDGRLTVRADLPGLTEKDVHVHVENDVLSIEGERRHEHEESREGVFHSERSYGSFRRAIRLPEGVDPSSIRASFEHGVLEVTMPSPQPKTSRHRVDVRTGAGTAQRTGPETTGPLPRTGPEATGVNAPRAEGARGPGATQNGTFGAQPAQNGTR